MARTAWIATTFVLSALFGCERGSDQQVVAYSSVDQVFSEPALRAFEGASGVKVRAVFDTEETKSTGVVNRLIAEAQNPQADVFWSGDSMRVMQLIRRNLVEPYQSTQAQSLPDYAKDRASRWTGIASRARVILVNTDKVASKDYPSSVKDLVDPRWRGQVTMANPLFGTTTMHVAALFTVWGEARGQAFLDAVRKNDVRIASSNGEVKRLVVSGEVAWGVTDTDDADEALKSGAPVAVVFPDQDMLGTLMIPTAVVLLKGGPNPKQGRALIDHLLSPSNEQHMVKAGAHLPLRSGVTPPERIVPPPNLRVMEVDYAELAETIERIQPWLRQWVGV
jgi:iron(III) transport system substrate-binding protein